MIQRKKTVSVGSHRHICILCLRYWSVISDLKQIIDDNKAEIKRTGFMWKSYLKTDKRFLSFPPLMCIHLSLLQAKKIKFCTTISAGIFILRVVEKEVIRDWRAPLALGYGRNFWNIETLQKVLLNQRYRTGKSLLFGLIYGRHREGYMILQEAGVALILESAWRLLSRVWWDHIDRGVIEWTHSTHSSVQ